jgi:transcriptional regulator with XRE-family HTH domain
MRRLQYLRERRGLSRSALSRLAEMHASSVGQIESGYIGTPYPRQLAKLATALGWEGDPAALIQEVTPDGD